MPTESEQQQEQENGATAVERETAGELLRNTRIERGLDEKQVADQLRITVHYIKAIETDRYEKLPGAIFARGYLKSYAKLLQLDTQDIVARYEKATPSARTSGLQVQNAVSDSGGSQGARWAMASVAAFAVLFLGVWIISGPTVESTAVTATENGDRAAPERGPASTSNPITTVERSIVDEPTLPVPENPVLRTNPEPAIVSPPAPVSVEAAATGTEPAADIDADPEGESPGDAAELVAEAAQDGVSEDTATPTADAVASAGPAQTAPGPAVETSETLPARDQASEPATDSGRAEELVAINVLEGDNGERIIRVDGNGNDVLRINFSGESWVEVNDAEQRLIYRDLRESGDILEVTGQAPFNVLLGDAPLTSLRLNGNAIDVSDDIRIDNSARLTVGL